MGKGDKRTKRGKIARAMASKISIAARIDWNNGEYQGDTLKAQLEKRVEQIRKKGKKAGK